MKEMKRIVFLIVTIVIPIFTLSCGVKAPPIPPEFMVPERIDDLQVQMEDGGVLLKWTIPEKNIDGSDLLDLKGFKVFRKDIPDEEIDCPPCSGEFEEFYDFTIIVPGRAVIVDDKVYLKDFSLSPNITYVYMVLTYNARGYLSDFSNIVEVYFERE